MKKLLISILICSSCIQMQGQAFRSWAKKNSITWSCIVVSGAADGMAESLKFHYPSVDRKLNLNDSFWNPDISWQNKYHSYIPFAKTAMVWTTDGYHLCRMIRNTAIVAGVAIKIGHKQKWYWYFADVVSYSIAYGIGFNTVYESLK